MNDKEEVIRQRAPIISRKTFAQVALEVFSIVLGVLAALAVSEWQQSEEIQERTQAALGSVRTELEQNLKLLEIVHVNNESLTLQLAGDSADLDTEANFVPALQISDSAWEMLRTTGLASYVDVELLVKLSDTYSLIDVYRRSGYSLVDANLAVLATTTAMERDMESIDKANLFARNFLDHFELIVKLEGALISSHRRALESLDTSTRLFE